MKESFSSWFSSKLLRKYSRTGRAAKAEVGVVFKRATPQQDIIPSSMRWRPRQESNLNLGFRKPSFYPLNYGDCLFSVFYAAGDARKG